MTRLILVAAAGLLLATANTPPTTEGELSSVVAAPAPAPADSAKPAKPPMVAKAAKPAKPAKPSHAVAGAYPRCSAAVRDRCRQGGSASAHPHRREMQLAMRAGERG